MAATRSKGADAPVLYQVTQNVVVYPNNQRVLLRADGQVYAADHPLVRQFPGMFKEVEPLTGRAAPRKVEQATAAPGETRDVAVPEQ